LRRAFGEALSAALSTSAQGAVVEARRLDLAQRDAAVRFIESHISDRALDAAVIAEGLGLSRSALYRLFQPHGGVAAYVMARRVAAVRDALENGSPGPLSDLAARFGFTDESHLNRRFSRVYGQPVGSYRRAVAMEASDSDGGRARRFAAWMSEVE
jgi:AraC-like DNA-binding protein